MGIAQLSGQRETRARSTLKFAEWTPHHKSTYIRSICPMTANAL